MNETVLTSEIKINKEVIQRLAEYKGVSQLKKAALNLLVKMVSDDDTVKDLR